MSLTTHQGLALANLQTVHGLTRGDLVSLLGLSPLPLGGVTPPPGGSPPAGTVSSYTISGAGQALANRVVVYQGSVNIGGVDYYLWESADYDCLLYRNLILGTDYRWTIAVDNNGDNEQELTCYMATNPTYVTPLSCTWLVVPGYEPGPNVVVNP